MPPLVLIGLNLHVVQIKRAREHAQREVFAENAVADCGTANRAVHMAQAGWQGGGEVVVW